MAELTTDILRLTSDAVVLVSRGRISYANPSAELIIGRNSAGKRIGEFFGDDICQAQASAFTADTVIGGKNYIVRMSAREDTQIYFISSPSVIPSYVTDALSCSLRSSLMNLGLQADNGRAIAERLHDEMLSDNLALLTKNYFQLSRIFSNSSVVRGIAENNLVFSPRISDISAMCRRLAEILNSLQDEVTVTVSGPETAFINCDLSLINQLLMNLLSNCLVHAKGLSRIALNISTAGQSVCISVTDDGCGISQDNLYMVFDRYCHGFSLTELDSGAGLGMTVVRGIAEKHGGVVLLESRPGKGTVVRVSLKKHTSAESVKSKNPHTESDIRDVLVGLSDSLPTRCYGEKYLD